MVSEEEEKKKITKELIKEAGIKSEFPKGTAGVDFSFNEFYNIEYNDEGKIKSRKVNIDKVVEYLTELFTFKTIFKSKSEEIFVYWNGIYLNKGRTIIQTETEQLLKNHSTNHNIREVQEKIKRLSAIDEEEFDKIPEHLICLENGILNLKTRKLEEHNPEYYFKTKLKIKYDKNSSCDNIKKFINDTFYPEDVKFIQEWLGFNLYRKYFIKKAVICFGERDTGKTIFLNLLMDFIGRENTAGISLQRISSGDKFALSSLKNKYSNVYDDLSSKDLEDQGGFKIATGGGFITAEQKFGDPFQFLNFAKHTFATNKIPPVSDVDDNAYYDRWIPIAFDNQLDKKEQDKFLIEKLTTKNEMSGLLNYALEGLKRLLTNEEFSYDKSCEEIKSIMERHSDPLSAFAQDWLIEKQGNIITKEQMFQIYSLYCNQTKKAKITKEQLGRRLGKKLYYALSKRGKDRTWENIDINKSNIDDDTLDTLQGILCNYIEKGKKSNSNNMYIIPRDASKVSQKTLKVSTIRVKDFERGLRK